MVIGVPERIVGRSTRLSLRGVPLAFRFRGAFPSGHSRKEHHAGRSLCFATHSPSSSLFTWRMAWMASAAFSISFSQRSRVHPARPICKSTSRYASGTPQKVIQSTYGAIRVGNTSFGYGARTPKRTDYETTDTPVVTHREPAGARLQRPELRARSPPRGSPKGQAAQSSLFSPRREQFRQTPWARP